MWKKLMKIIIVSLYLCSNLIPLCLLCINVSGHKTNSQDLFVCFMSRIPSLCVITNKNKNKVYGPLYHHRYDRGVLPPRVRYERQQRCVCPSRWKLSLCTLTWGRSFVKGQRVFGRTDQHWLRDNRSSLQHITEIGFKSLFAPPYFVFCQWTFAAEWSVLTTSCCLVKYIPRQEMSNILGPMQGDITSKPTSRHRVSLLPFFFFLFLKRLLSRWSQYLTVPNPLCSLEALQTFG